MRWLLVVDDGVDLPTQVVAVGATDAGFRLVVVDGDRPDGALGIDPGFVDAAGAPATVSLCLAPDDLDLPYDDPAVPAAVRAVLLGRPPAACTTLSRSPVHLGGAITAWRGSVGDDPFARLLPARTVQVGPGLVADQWALPCGPATQRYGGAPWPVDRFPG